MTIRSMKQNSDTCVVWSSGFLNQGNLISIAFDVRTVCARALPEWQVEQIESQQQRFSKEMDLVDKFGTTSKLPDILSNFSSFFQDVVDNHVREKTNAVICGLHIAVSALGRTQRKTGKDIKPIARMID